MSERLQQTPFSRTRTQSYRQRPMVLGRSRGGVMYTQDRGRVRLRSPAPLNVGHDDRSRLYLMLMRRFRGSQLLVHAVTDFIRPPKQRRLAIVNLFSAALIIVSVIMPALSVWQSQANYDLSAARHLLSPTPKHLQEKFRYDYAKQTWLFNEHPAEQLPTPGNNSVKVGGLTYSAQLPSDLRTSQGLTMTDAQHKLDITLKPQFGLGTGRDSDGHVIYPLNGSRSQLVYTFQQNGVKEDIILYEAPGDTAEYRYDLQLPAGMEARLQRDGSVGIYGGDPTLFGDISYGSDKDRALVEKARTASDKTQLYYVIPAPAITGNGTDMVKAHFTLDGTSLTVKVSGLAKAHYPLSIDPSFVMDTSCSWKQNANNEGNISYEGCELSRDELSGGALGPWHYTDNSVDRGTTQNTGSGAANGLIQPRDAHATVAYNGFLYALGGANTGGLILATIERAPINNDGTLGTWVPSGSLPEGRQDHEALVYNGYMYVVAGYVGGGPQSADVKYAPINSDGSLGAWNATTSIPVARRGHAVVIYSSKMYVIDGCTQNSGGCNTANPVPVVYCADIHGDGTVGSWSNCNATNLSGRDGLGATVYNGYIYVAGGCVTYSFFACTSQPATLQYSKINADGSLSDWQTTTTSFATGRQGVELIAKGGYLYLTGGTGNSYTASVQIAPVYANGKVGPWATTTSFNQPRTNFTLTNHGDYFYVVSGCINYSANCNDQTNDVQYAQISPPGGISPFATEADVMPTTNGGIHSAATVMYGGYVYILGGRDKDTQTNAVRYAKLNPDGSTGAWGTTSSFTDARLNLAATAYNGYMYIAGGNRTGATTNCPDLGIGTEYCTDIQYATINGDGTLGTWNSAGGPYAGTGNTGRNALGMTAYDGYMYVIGGTYNNNSDVSAEVDIAPINTNGTVGTWTQNTTALGTGRSHFQLAQMGPYVYIAGGRKAPGGFDNADVIYATLSSSGAMSSWASAGLDFNIGRTGHITAAANGYLYIATGANNGSTDVQYIKVDMSDGAFDGSWTTSTIQVPLRRINAMGGIHNGYLYVIGGCQSMTLEVCNNPDNTVQYAQIYNNGGGSPSGWSLSSNTTNPAHMRSITVVVNDYIYAVSGCNSWQTVISSGCDALTGAVSYAKINPITGDVGTWANTTAGVTPREFHSGFAYNGYIYVLGGCTEVACDTTTLEIQYGKPDASGNITSWSTNPTTLPSGMARNLGAVNVGSRVYIFNGNTGASYYSTIDTSNGQIDGANWVSGPTMPSVYNDGSTTIATNGKYIYLLGHENTIGDRTMVQYISVNNDGTLGTWQYGPSLERYRKDGYVTAIYNGYLYVVAGYDPLINSQLSDTLYAPIFSDGSLGRWQSGPDIGGNRALISGVIHEGYFYIVGGLAGATPQTSFYWSALQSTSNIARYSILLQTDQDTMPVNFFANFNRQSGSSAITIGFAGSTMASPGFGTVAATTNPTSGTKYPLSITDDGVRYYRITIKLDDSKSMTFGETNGSSMSFFQLNYHPNAAMRLRGGKTFNDNVLQSLDAY